MNLIIFVLSVWYVFVCSLVHTELLFILCCLFHLLLYVNIHYHLKVWDQQDKLKTFIQR